MPAKTTKTIAADKLQKAVDILSGFQDRKELESGEYLCVEFRLGLELGRNYPEEEERTGGIFVNVFWDGNVTVSPVPIDGVAERSGNRELAQAVVEIDFTADPPTWREIAAGT